MENGPEVKIKRMMKYLIEVDKNTHGVYFVFIRYYLYIFGKSSKL